MVDVKVKVWTVLAIPVRAIHVGIACHCGVCHSRLPLRLRMSVASHRSVCQLCVDSSCRYLVGHLRFPIGHRCVDIIFRAVSSVPPMCEYVLVLVCWSASQECAFVCIGVFVRARV